MENRTIGARNPATPEPGPGHAGAEHPTASPRRRAVHRVAAAALALVALLAARPLSAQEVQLPVDESGAVQVIDGALARELGIFVDRYPNLQEVRLFQLPDGSYVLEFTSLEGGLTVRQREPASEARVQELRSLVSAGLAARSRATVDQSGRVQLLVSAAALGLGFYGWAVPVAADVEETRSGVALYMLTAASTIAIPWITTRHAPVSEAMADLAFHGATRGIIRGLLLERLLRSDEPEIIEGDPHDRDREVTRNKLAAAMIMSIGEAVGGYFWARNAGMDRGLAYSIENGSDFGMMAGAAIAGLIDPDDFGESRLAPGLALLGAAVGTPLGARLGVVRHYSHGDAHLIRTAGFLGTAAGLTVASWSGSDADRPYVLGGLLGGLGGLALGDVLVRATDFEVGPARLIQLATIAGAAVGLGGAYLVSGDDWDDGSRAVVLTLGTLGAGGAFALTYRAFADDARANAARRSGLRIDVFPTLALAPATRELRPAATLRLEYRIP